MPPEDAIDDHRLHQLLGTLVERHRIPGAVLGVFDGNRTVSVGAGTANLNTGAAMTADTRFLLGSVTKVWIATLTMSMVDAGELDLDEPVRRYLPEFRLADDRRRLR